MATFVGSAANDSFMGTPADDVIYGFDPNAISGGGSDTLSGSDGNDTIFALVGPTDHGVVDELSGGEGADVLNFLVNRGTALSSVALNGGAGNDTINVTVNDTAAAQLAGAMSISGGDGVDVVTLNIAQIGADVAKLSFTGVEALVVTGSAVSLTAAQIAGVSGDIQFIPSLGGSALPALTVLGGGAVDLSASPAAMLVGVGPAVSLIATTHDDVIEVGPGNGTVSGPDVLHGGLGNDTINFAAAAAGSLIYGDAGDDVLTNVPAYASPYASALTYEPQTIDGGSGNDTLTINASFSDGDLTLSLAATPQGLTLPDSAVIRNVETVNISIFGENNVVHMGAHGGDVSLFTPGAPTTIYSGPGDDTMVADVVYETPGGFDQVVTPATVDPSGGSQEANAPVLHIDYSTATAPVHMASATTITAFTSDRGAYESVLGYYDEAWVGGTAANDLGATASVKFLETADVLGSQYDDVLMADGHQPPATPTNRVPSAYGTTLDFSESLYGGAGNDTLVAGSHGGLLDGGAGDDTAVFNFAHTLASYQHVGSTLVVSGPDGSDTLVGIEHLQFADGVFAPSADGPPVVYDPGRVLTAGVAPQVLTGGSGPDTLYGDANDTLVGGVGDDALYGGVVQDDALGYALPATTAAYAGLSIAYHILAAPALVSHAQFSPEQVSQTILVAGGDEGGVDTLADVAHLQFLDGTLNFDPTGAPAEIYRLYDTFLNRVPDAAGFDFFQQYLASGHSLHDAALLAGSGAEFLSATGNLSNAQYVAYLYENTVDRAPDAFGLQQYTADLDGGESRVDLALRISEGAEHVTDTDAAIYAGLWTPDVAASGLALLYDAALERAPDAYGLKAFEAALASGTTFRDIANQAATSPEFQAHYGDLTDKQFIDTLYLNTVHRAADPSGEASYLNELSHGYTRGDVIWQVAIGAEHEGYVLSHPDPSLFVF